MTRTATLTALTAFLLLTGIAVSQPAGFDSSDRGGFGPRDDRHERRLETMTEYLDLTEAQTYEWETLSASQRESRGASFDALRDGQEALQEILESGAPDATRVGEIVIDLHNQRRSIQAQREADLESLKQILTPDQVEKLDAMMAAKEFGRERGPRGRGHRSGSRSGNS